MSCEEIEPPVKVPKEFVHGWREKRNFWPGDQLLRKHG